MGYREHQKQEKGGFWNQYKILIFGILGALLLVCTLSTQNIVVSYHPAEGEPYLVKLDYSAFGFCLRCMPGSKNASDVVEKEIFFLQGKKESVENAASALRQVAGTEEGVFKIQASGLLSPSAETTQKMIRYLNEKGYPTTAIKES